ncbi:lactose-binding lectin l-2 [Ictalurus punctatus]|uniref:Lactose-binding lectin l-2 n=1 Tax=Ictalurus punctatus TaxID=7998 RepID=A0A9F7RLJ9_ICTPU|nr:lactose-binding lectin l-2 [Ictalurus punctatus]XP_053537562.1 lactose-binding lectin l-2 [Ictalurus punctatus]
MDWASAEKHCLDLDAHLVSIHSEKEYQRVKALIRAHDYQENPTWIGLSGCQKTNRFFWSDGTKLTFTKWNPPEPNFLFGECCVHMNYGYSKNWNDISCRYTYPFVCAKSFK